MPAPWNRASAMSAKMAHFNLHQLTIYPYFTRADWVFDVSKALGINFL